jgi:hypothetical protein
MLGDQTSPDFLEQLKTFAKGFLAWVGEEGNEPEHPGIAPDQEDFGLDEQPALMRTKTTTVHDFQPVATDPPVSQAQRGAMHAAAHGQSNIGIPQSVGREFAEADPGGKLPEKKGEDDVPGMAQNLEERFELSPDGSQIHDKQTGSSHDINDVMRILFSGGAPDTAASLKPETRVSRNPVDKADVPTAKWKSPKISTRGNDDTMTGGAMGGARGEQGWSVPKFPPQKDNGLGPGEGGAALGRLLKFKAGEDHGMRSGMRGTVDGTR